MSALYADTFGGSRLSKSTVSRVTQQLNQDFDMWRRRDLSDLPVVYVFLDGQYHAARQGTDEKEGVLSAYALREDGRPVLLHLDLGPRESYDAWLSFLSGHPPTYVNLAKRMGISTVALWKFRRRHPWVDAWSDKLMLDHARTMFGAILRRMGLTALQGGGSPQHADQYCKIRAGFYDRSEDAGDSPLGAGTFQMNFLIPRPELPVIAGVTVREVQSPQLPASSGPNDGKAERVQAPDSVPFVKVR